MSGGRGGTNAGLIIAAIIGAVAVVVGALITARSNVERMEVLLSFE